MSLQPKRIAIITGTRAEYGLLSPLIKAVHQHPQLELQLLPTCMHFAPEFGSTIRDIENDGIPITERIETLLCNDSPAAISKTMGLTLISFADCLQRLQPDLVIVLGDRFEILAAVQAAVMAHIPVAHLHGGERSEGAIDECLRHAITKLSSLHFVAAEPYQKRVIQMGEHPERVFNVGAPGLETLSQLSLLDPQSFGCVSGNLNFLVAFHPETCQPENTEAQCQQLFAALEAFPDANVVMTKSNADESGRLIGELMERFASTDPTRYQVYDNLGSQKFLSVMQQADVMIGNSSSGIIEAPAMHTATVNIGERQRGRLRASSVIDCQCQRDDIIASIQTALSPAFQANLTEVIHPYGDGNVSAKIVEILLQTDLASLQQKPFYDLPEWNA